MDLNLPPLNLRLNGRMAKVPAQQGAMEQKELMLMPALEGSEVNGYNAVYESDNGPYAAFNFGDDDDIDDDDDFDDEDDYEDEDDDDLEDDDDEDEDDDYEDDDDDDYEDEDDDDYEDEDEDWDDEE